MKLNFQSVAILVALVCFALASVSMFAPALLLSSWGVEYSSSAGLVSRRMAALFAGIAVMFFTARKAEPSPSRSALTMDFAVACLILAALGLFEFASGHASADILAAVFIDVALALVLLSLLYTAHIKKQQPRKLRS
ncbi:MAG: hypothetical protein V4448_16085 [Pseudomonadota bacterium]